MQFGIIGVQKVCAFGIICIQKVGAIWRHMQERVKVGAFIFINTTDYFIAIQPQTDLDSYFVFDCCKVVVSYP